MEDHTLLTFIALAGGGMTGTRVPVVSLDAFLAENECVLEQILRPGGSDSRGGDRVDRFLRRLCLNPRYRPQTFLKGVPEAARRAVFSPASQPGAATRASARRRHDLAFDTIALEPFEYPGARFYRLEPGEQVSALEVLATASDEPDYGMDLHLFSDSGTEWGGAYPFGPQPFGSPGHPFSSQAPFHMAFYHEAPLLYRIAPGLRHTFSSLRVRQFSALAHAACTQGCAYWGFRFAGWALHYLQDLTMPYHAAALPGWKTGAVLVRGLLRSLGVTRPYDTMLRTVTRRHVMLEALLLEKMNALCGSDPAGGLQAELRSDPLLRALRDETGGEEDVDFALSGPCLWPEPVIQEMLEESARAGVRLAPAADRALRHMERLQRAGARGEGAPGAGTPGAATQKKGATQRGASPLLEVWREMLGNFGRVTRRFVARCGPSA